jgi:hypothetical protein
MDGSHAGNYRRCRCTVRLPGEIYSPIRSAPVVNPLQESNKKNFSTIPKAQGGICGR